MVIHFRTKNGARRHGHHLSEAYLFVRDSAAHRSVCFRLPTSSPFFRGGGGIFVFRNVGPRGGRENRGPFTGVTWGGCPTWGEPNRPSPNPSSVFSCGKKKICRILFNWRAKSTIIKSDFGKLSST